MLRAPRARPVYHGMLAMAAAAAGEHALAERTARALDQLFPQSATAAYWSGYARLEFDADAAARSFAAATARDASFAAAWAELGAARMLLGDFAAAATALERATQLEPHNCKAWINRGLCQARLGERKTAIASLRHATTLPTAVPGANYNLGVLLAENDPDQAIAAFASTVAQAPDYVEAWYNLGALQTRRGLLDKGRDALQRAVALRADWADAWRQLGTNRATAGDASAAAEAYGKVVALAPEDEAARTYLDSLLGYLRTQTASEAPDAGQPQGADDADSKRGEPRDAPRESKPQKPTAVHPKSEDQD